MEDSLKKKYIKSLTIMAVFNACGGALFLTSFYISKITAFLWAGLIIIGVTALVMIWFFYKISKIK
jgi:hypothetical protein